MNKWEEVNWLKTESDCLIREEIFGYSCTKNCS